MSHANPSFSREKQSKVGVSSVILEYDGYLFVNMWYLHLLIYSSIYLFQEKKNFQSTSENSKDNFFFKIIP